MVGALFRYKRELSGISQAELARRIGIDPSALNRIESGVLTGKPATLAALSRELSIPADEVFDAILNGYEPPGGGARDGNPSWTSFQIGSNWWL